MTGATAMPTATMHDYWRRQPWVLESILRERAGLTAEFVGLYQETQPDRLHLVGSGTSFHAATAAAPFMESVLGIEVSVVTASAAHRLHGRRPMLVALSQGGTSTNTIAAVQRLAQVPHLAITGDPDSELQRVSARHASIGCGPELVGPKTVGYTASVMHLYLCALEAARATHALTHADYAQLADTLEAGVVAMPENLRRTEAWFDAHAEALGDVDSWVVVGRGEGGLVAAEGALKLIETVRVPCLGYEFEEYLHGPVLMTGPRLGGLYFVTNQQPDRRRMLTLARNHAQQARSVFRIAVGSDFDEPGSLVLVGDGHPQTAPFEFVLAPQLVAARVPTLRGMPDGAEIFRRYAGELTTKHPSSASS